MDDSLSGVWKPLWSNVFVQGRKFCACLLVIWLEGSKIGYVHS